MNTHTCVYDVSVYIAKWFVDATINKNENDDDYETCVCVRACCRVIHEEEEDDDDDETNGLHFAFNNANYGNNIITSHTHRHTLKGLRATDSGRVVLCVIFFLLYGSHNKSTD